MLRQVLIVACVIMPVARSAAAFEPVLVRQVRDIDQIAPSPDGARVAVVISRSAAEGGGSDVWVARRGGVAAEKVGSIAVAPDERATDPSWSADGSELFFRISGSSGVQLQRWHGPQGQSLSLIRQSDGEIVAIWRPVGEVRRGIPVRRYALSPNGRYIAVALEGASAAGTSRPTGDDARVESNSDPDDELLLLAMDGGATPHRYPLPDNVWSLNWNPDGRRLAIVAGSDDDQRGPIHSLWTLDTDGQDVQPVAGIAPSITEAVWTSEGFAYLARCTEDAPPDCRALFTRNAEGGLVKELTLGLDGSLMDGIVAERGGKAVIGTVMVGLDQRPVRVALTDGGITWLSAPGPVVSSLVPAVDGTFAMIASGPTIDRSVYLKSPTDRLPQPVDLLPLHPTGWIVANPKRVTWRYDGRTLDGLLAMPVDHHGRVPLVTWVHGGPYGAFQDRRYNLVDLLTSHGMAVFMPNPRGSKGRGAAFARDNRGDLGGGDLRDVQAGIAAIERNFAVDRRRMAMIGYSYGGTMACFAAGRTSIFKAFVAGAPVVDQVSEFGTEDSSFDDRWYLGDPRIAHKLAWRQSPLSTASRAHAAMLILQGDADAVDPPSQALQMYRALKDAGLSPTLIRYPRETHASLAAAFGASVTREPWHGADVAARMIAFLQQHLGIEDKPRD